MQRETVDPVAGGLAAHLAAYVGEVVGRDAEARGIVGQVAVADVCTVIEQADEAAEQLAGPFGHVCHAPAAGVDVVEVEDVCCQEVACHFFAEEVVRVGQPLFQAKQVFTTSVEVAVRQPYDWILKQRQVTNDAVVAAQGERCDVSLVEAHDEGAKAVGCDEAAEQHGVRQDDIVVRHGVILRVLECETHASRRAEYVEHVAGTAQGVAVVQCVDEAQAVCGSVRGVHFIGGYRRKVNDYLRKVKIPPRFRQLLSCHHALSLHP